MSAMINNVLPIFISALFCFAPAAEPSPFVEPRAQVTVVSEAGEFTYTDELITPSDFTVAEQIEQRRINAPLSVKLELVDEWLGKGADYKTALTYCFPRLAYTVRQVADALYIAPVDASVIYADGKFSVLPESTGRALDESRLYASVYYALKSSDENRRVNAHTLVLQPAVTRAELEANLVKRSEYTTEYFSSLPDRAHNVELAASKFDGVSIPAGGSISFNNTVGERTTERGFRSAKIIVDGKYTDGVGGGVCQASTALYNAALIAGLDCIARSHTICPSYCEPGLDAMISSVSDLIITNNTCHAVYFSVRSGGGATTVSIFGEPSEYEIVPQSVVLREIEPQAQEFIDTERKYFRADSEPGDIMLIAGGVSGYDSETYLCYLKDGKQIKRVKIRANSYKPSPQITAISP